MYVAIIPARGSSRRLPRKNVRSLLGRPALAYPVAAARESGVFERVIVSTEDAAIAAAARDAGAEVVVRPAPLAADGTSMADVCRHVLDGLAAEGVQPRALCCVFATAVLLEPDDFRGSRAVLESDPSLDGVMATAEFGLTPLQAIRPGTPLVPMFPEYWAMNTSDHPHVIGDAGAFYWMWEEAFAREKAFFTSRMQGYGLPRNRVVDVNTIEDWRVLECLMRLHREQEGGSP